MRDREERAEGDDEPGPAEVVANADRDRVHAGRGCVRGTGVGIPIRREEAVPGDPAAVSDGEGAGVPEAARHAPPGERGEPAEHGGDDGEDDECEQEGQRREHEYRPQEDGPSSPVEVVVDGSVPHARHSGATGRHRSGRRESG